MPGTCSVGCRLHSKWPLTQKWENVQGQTHWPQAWEEGTLTPTERLLQPQKQAVLRAGRLEMAVTRTRPQSRSSAARMQLGLRPQQTVTDGRGWSRRADASPTLRPYNITTVRLQFQQRTVNYDKRFSKWFTSRYSSGRGFSTLITSLWYSHVPHFIKTIAEWTKHSSICYEPTNPKIKTLATGQMFGLRVRPPAARDTSLGPSPWLFIPQLRCLNWLPCFWLQPGHKQGGNQTMGNLFLSPHPPLCLSY